MAEISRPPPEKAVPVEIVAPDPIPVVLANDPRTVDGRLAPPHREQVQRQSTDPSKPATTTFQEDLTKAGQRHINVMWESTQKATALIVTTATMIACCFLIYQGDTALVMAAFLFLSNICTQVLTTYFQRTNHTKTGGVDGKDVTR